MPQTPDQSVPEPEGSGSVACPQCGAKLSIQLASDEADETEDPEDPKAALRKQIVAKAAQMQGQ